MEKRIKVKLEFKQWMLSLCVLVVAFLFLQWEAAPSREYRIENDRVKTPKAK